MAAHVLVGCRKLFQWLLQNWQIPCSNRGDAAEPGKPLPMPWTQELDTSSRLRCSQMENSPGWMHYSIVPVPAATDAGWAWRLRLLRCKVFSSSFSFSYFSKGKHLWMSLPEAITSTWRTWLSKPIDFTNGRRWAAYTTAPVLSPLHWDSTYQLSEEKKYRTSRDSLTSIFIPLLKKNRSPHHANSIYLRHSLFKKASVVRNPRLHWWGMGVSKSYLTAAPKGIELIPFPRRRNWRTEWENA